MGLKFGQYCACWCPKILRCQAISCCSDEDKVTHVRHFSDYHELWLPVYDQITSFNRVRLGQNGRQFADDIFKYIFLNKNVWISIKTSIKKFANVCICHSASMIGDGWWDLKKSSGLFKCWLNKKSHNFLSHSTYQGSNGRHSKPEHSARCDQLFGSCGRI